MKLLKKTVLVIGAGRSGKAAHKLLLHHNINSILFDDYVLEFNCTFDMADISAVILSPGIDRGHALVTKALEQNLPILNEMELASLFLPAHKMIGITGTNGKSTTTVMLESMLKSAGLKAIACGNLGLPLCELALGDEKFDHFLIELSSFQLETISLLKLDAAIIINITPDHLERYQTFAEYKEAKLKIISLLKPAGLLILNDQIDGIDYEPCTHFSATSPKFSKVRELVFGEHNQENAIAAAIAAEFLGLSEYVIDGLKNFKALPHRCEEIGEYEGITYINDSKGTTVVAVMKALTMMKKPVHLLLGGIHKGEDFSKLSQKDFPQVADYYVYGQATPKITHDLSLNKSYSDLKSALLAAKKQAKTGDIILLSPGCASYDQFDNYVHRGNVFKELSKSSI